MLNVTLLELKNRSRQRADMENSTFIGDGELTAMLNASATELLDLLVTSFEDYNLDSAPLALIAGTDSYSLPSNFYKLRGVDLNGAGVNGVTTLEPFNFGERNQIAALTLNALGAAQYRYRLQGNKIRFLPLPTGAASLTLWFIPACTRLVLDTDVLDGVNGWEEYVIVDAAIKMRVKEESDVQALMVEKAALKLRIEQAAASRDAGRPERVTDVHRAHPFQVEGVY